MARRSASCASIPARAHEPTSSRSRAEMPASGAVISARYLAITSRTPRRPRVNSSICLVLEDAPRRLPACSAGPAHGRGAPDSSDQIAQA